MGFSVSDVLPRYSVSSLSSVLLSLGVAADVALLDPVPLERSRGFKSKEINRIQEVVVARQQTLLESWDEFFGS